LLRRRLTRRGIISSSIMSGTALTALFGQGATAAVPTILLESTTKAALGFVGGTVSAVSIKVVTLAEGMLKTMLLSKLQAAVLSLLIIGAIAMGATTLLAVHARNPATRPTEPRPVAVASDDDPDAVPPAGQDRFKDPLPPDAVIRLGSVRWRHGEPVNYAQF